MILQIRFPLRIMELHIMKVTRIVLSILFLLPLLGCDIITGVKKGNKTRIYKGIAHFAGRHFTEGVYDGVLEMNNTEGKLKILSKTGEIVALLPVWFGNNEILTENSKIAPEKIEYLPTHLMERYEVMNVSEDAELYHYKGQDDKVRGEVFVALITAGSSVIADLNMWLNATGEYKCEFRGYYTGANEGESEETLQEVDEGVSLSTLLSVSSLEGLGISKTDPLEGTAIYNGKSVTAHYYESGAESNRILTLFDSLDGSEIGTVEFRLDSNLLSEDNRIAEERVPLDEPAQFSVRLNSFKEDVARNPGYQSYDSLEDLKLYGTTLTSNDGQKALFFMILSEVERDELKGEPLASPVVVRHLNMNIWLLLDDNGVIIVEYTADHYNLGKK
jgi:hypothetical protein